MAPGLPAELQQLILEYGQGAGHAVGFTAGLTVPPLCAEAFVASVAAALSRSTSNAAGLLHILKTNLRVLNAGNLGDPAVRS
jgi:cytochrome c biogenesis protein CcdA